MVIKSSQGATPSSLRKAHRGMILSEIQKNPGISRADLARILGLSDMAASRIVRELVGSKIVIEDAEANGQDDDEKQSVGRPKIGLKVNRTGVYAAGIVLSAYHSEVSISDAAGRIFARMQVQDGTNGDLTTVARRHAVALKNLIEASEIDKDRIIGVGVALSAVADPERGLIQNSDYFGWGDDGGQFVDILTEVIGLPVQIENIANALAIAEMRFGVAKDVQNFVLFHAATLTGASLISGGRVVRGSTGLTGRVGHFQADHTGLTCVCGRHDCLNLSTTGFALLAQLGLLDHQRYDSSKIGYYASTLMTVIQDGSARDRLPLLGAKLARALNAVSVLLDPKIIVLSGYLGSSQDYVDGARKAFDLTCSEKQRGAHKVVRGEISPVEAAPLLALSALFYSDKLDFDRFSKATSRRMGGNYA